MSAIAAAQPMNTDEEMKTAAKLFQQAAGVFAHLRDTVLGLVHQVILFDFLSFTVEFIEFSDLSCLIVI